MRRVTKATKKKVQAVPDRWPMVVETFQHPAYEMQRLRFHEPSAFNGDVRIHRFRVTAERIEEPVDVLAARLQKLWDECDNHHHWQPLRTAAREIGYELKGEQGSKRKKVGDRMASDYSKLTREQRIRLAAAWGVAPRVPTGCDSRPAELICYTCDVGMVCKRK